MICKEKSATNVPETIFMDRSRKGLIDLLIMELILFAKRVAFPAIRQR
jgi:hypothetical protein